MCCRACAGFELCRTKNKLTDDCCPQCQYFESCMEEDKLGEEKVKEPMRRPPIRRR